MAERTDVSPADTVTNKNLAAGLKGEAAGLNGRTAGAQGRNCPAQGNAGIVDASRPYGEDARRGGVSQGNPPLTGPPRGNRLVGKMGSRAAEQSAKPGRRVAR
jgi:hypothetical protein